MLTCTKMVSVSLSSLSRMERGRNLNNTQHHTPHFRSAFHQRKHLHKAEVATTAFHRPPRPDTGDHRWPRALSHSAKATKAAWPCNPPQELCPGAPVEVALLRTPPPPAHTQGHRPPPGRAGGRSFPHTGERERWCCTGAQGHRPRPAERQRPEGNCAALHTGTRVRVPVPSCLSLFLKTMITRSIY